MKKLFLALQFVFVICLNVCALPNVCTSLEDDYSDNEPGKVVVPVPVPVPVVNGEGIRTFKPKEAVSKERNFNFKAELFSTGKSAFDLTAMNKGVSIYSVDFTGKIDVTPGEDKFWDLENEANLIESSVSVNNQDVQTGMNFKDCNYHKAIPMTILGQEVNATEYYYLTEEKLYSKGFSIEEQIVTGSGITIRVPAQEVLYNPSKVVCYFPLSYDTQPHALPSYNQTVNASISGISALGIPDGTPVSYSIAFEDSYKVVAWGGLQLLHAKEPVSAVLTQFDVKTVATIFVNGSKAPQPLLTSLKLTQDLATSSTHYSFRNKTFFDNIAEFKLIGEKVADMNMIKNVK